LELGLPSYFTCAAPFMTDPPSVLTTVNIYIMPA